MRKTIGKLSCILLAVPVIFIVAGLLSCPYKAYADDDTIRTFKYLYDVTQGDIDAKKAERDKAVQQAAEYEAQANELRTQKGELQGELEELNGLSAEQKAQYEEIAHQLAEALIAKSEALDTYVKAQENLIETREMFSNRISVMFEYQNKSTLEVLLESDSIAGFFTNMEMISLIADADNQAVDQMQIALDDAELQAEVALQEAEDMQAIADEKAAQLKELEDRIGVTTAALDDVSTRLSEAEQKEIELNNYASTLDSEIKSLQDQLYAQQQKKSQSSGGSSTGKSGGGSGSMQWPTWCTTITSTYGWREHPVYHDQRFHSGIDIGAWYGDSVMAAKGGTVILVSTPVPGQDTGGSGYGNYVIIDHGNGLSTLYGHMRNVYVYNGQTVSAGEVIGEVGSTGTSNGPHLHFEVRVNGSTVDPLGYLP
ncbi:MAG: peptidoglycan DD-metalloendopeptidase family protein [Clostridiales bacterium]|nr:peptidoglycan DD-metalloendopeptidase family protein [Clostridiales bacterium]